MSYPITLYTNLAVNKDLCVLATEPDKQNIIYVILIGKINDRAYTQPRPFCDHSHILNSQMSIL